MNVLNHPSIASPWLSGLDLAGKPWDVIIAGVEPVTVPDRSGKTEEVLAVGFRLVSNGQPLRKRLLLRPTTAKQIARLFGIESDAWIGKGITIRPENVQAFGATHCVVRVAGAVAVKMHQPKQAEPDPTATLDTPRDTADDLWADERAA